MNRTTRQYSPAALTAATICAMLCLAGRCPGQGTLTVTFDGQPPGTFGTISGYNESGMTFWNPYNPANLVRVGPGLTGYASDGTACLAVTPGGTLGFDFDSGRHFNLISFDAAGYNLSSQGASLVVVGYGAMGLTITNYFTVDSLATRRANDLPDFQTLYLDSQFQDLYRIDVLTGGWSLDNVLLGGVPEPSALAIAATAVCCAFAHRRITRRKKPETPKA